MLQIFVATFLLHIVKFGQHLTKLFAEQKECPFYGFQSILQQNTLRC